MNSNYFSGPREVGDCAAMSDMPKIIIPVPFALKIDDKVNHFVATSDRCDAMEHLVKPGTFSGFSKLIVVYKHVLKFINILKGRLKNKVKDSGLPCVPDNLLLDSAFY